MASLAVFLGSRNHLTLMYTKNEYFPILHLWQKSIKKKIGFIDKVYRFPFTALDCIQKLMSEGVIVECFMLSTQHGWAVTHYPIKWKNFLHVQILLTKLLTRDMLSWGSISQIFLSSLKNFKGLTFTFCILYSIILCMQQDISFVVKRISILGDTNLT